MGESPASGRVHAREARAVGGLLLLVAWLYLLPIASGSHTFLAFGDAREQYYAWFQKLAEALSRGSIPLWDANTSAGHSFVGEIQSGAFYPLNWLWAWAFGRAGSISPKALDQLIVLHLMLAAGGMYALLRTWRLGICAAFAGAATFALLGPVALRAGAQANIFAGLCWAPLAVLLAHRHFDSGRLRDGIAAGVVLGLQVLAGHVQPAVHTALIIAALGLSEAWREREGLAARLRMWIVGLAPIAFVSALVALPQLLLAKQYLDDAYRWIGTDDPLAPGQPIPWAIFAYRYIVRLGDLPSVVDPWRFAIEEGNALYFGSAGLVLAVLVACARREHRPEVLQRHGRWLLAIAAFGLFAALGHYTLLAPLLRLTPVLGQIRELGRYTFMFHFAASVIVAAGVHVLIATAATRRVPRRQAFGALLGLLILAQLAWMTRDDGELTRVGVVHGVAALVVVGALAIRRVSPSGVAVAVVALIAFDAYAYRGLALPLRVSPYVRAAFAGGPIVTRLEPDYGRYRVYLHASAGLPQNYGDAHRLQTIAGYGATAYRPYFDFMRSGWGYDDAPSRMLGARYVIARDSLPLTLLVEDRDSGLRLYENPRAWPRVVLRSRLADAAESSAPELVEYGDHVQRFRIHADHDDQAIVGEIDYPGWCARVNGAAVPIRRSQIDGTPALLREVPVRAGENLIEFEYRPYRALLFGC